MLNTEEKKAKHAAYMREWMANPENRARSQAASRKHYANNSAKIKAYQSNHRKENRAQYAKYNRNWNNVHVDYWPQLRAKKRKAKGTCSKEQLQARINFYGGKCWMCGAAYETIDHVKPLAKGGSHWPSNLRPACKSCNCGKGGKWPLIRSTNDSRL